jgi:hypothetical protein
MMGRVISSTSSRNNEVGGRGFLVMGMVEITLGKFQFGFRELSWFEESTLKIADKDARRVVLAAALVKVNDLPIQSVKEAEEVLSAVGMPVIHRVFVTYKSKLRKPTYQIAPLYKAPPAKEFKKQIDEKEEAVEAAIDPYMQDTRFSPKELKEARDLDQRIIKSSKMRGAIKIPNE